MNKTPYEVRLDVLKMAKDFLLESKQQAHQKLQLKRDAPGGITKADIVEYENISKSYSTADIMAKANELYAFVNNKTTIT